LPTSLTYIVLSLEAVHLGDLLRIWVRPGVKITLPRQDFQGPTAAHRTPREARCFTGTTSLSPAQPIPGSPSLTKKRELFPGLPPTSPGAFALPHRTPPAPIKAPERPISTPGFGNINPIPFRLRKGTRVTATKPTNDRPTDRRHTVLLNGALHWLRTMTPCSTGCSHGTFSHFSLQKSRVEYLVLHRDLDPRWVHRGPRPPKGGLTRGPNTGGGEDPSFNIGGGKLFYSRGLCRRCLLPLFRVYVPDRFLVAHY